MSNDRMKQQSKCPQCGNAEYIGMLHWRDGKMYCRHCIAALWKKEGSKCLEPFKHYYPLYEDGINYIKENGVEVRK